MQTPANPDWQQGRNNLLIRYALTAPHPERQTLRDLLPHIADPQTLQHAQRILIDCGSVSYCVYHLIRRYRAASHMVDATPLADPAPLRDLLSRQVEPVITLLKMSHAEIPAELRAR